MSFWATFWTWFLLAGLGLFFGLAVVVSIGGFFNIRSLFKSLTERTEQDDA